VNLETSSLEFCIISNFLYQINRQFLQSFLPYAAPDGQPLASVAASIGDGHRAYP